MKKILSLGLVAAMAVSAMPMAYATTDVSNGTEVEYLGSKTTIDGEGNEVYAEAYTVTVPAKMAPGDSAFVKAEGTWNSARKLVVTADENVTLVNSINTGDDKVLDVTFNGINLVGDNNVAVANYGDGVEGEAIAVADIQNALFGTWSGVFEYQAEIVDNVELITFSIMNLGYDNMYSEGDESNILTFQAEEGMTWAEWCASKYNTVQANCDDYDDASVSLDNYSGGAVELKVDVYSTEYNDGDAWVRAADVIVPNAIYNRHWT